MAGSTSHHLGGGRSVDRKSHSLSSQRIAIFHTKVGLVWIRALVWCVLSSTGAQLLLEALSIKYNILFLGGVK